jgi:hypothetical protein
VADVLSGLTRGKEFGPNIDKMGAEYFNIEVHLARDCHLTKCDESLHFMPTCTPLQNTGSLKNDAGNIKHYQ